MEINTRCLQLFALIVVMTSGMASQFVEFTSDANVNGTYGGNVTIAWNVKAKVGKKVIFNIITGDANGKVLMRKTVDILEKPQSIDFDRSASTLNIVNRVYAKYTSKGTTDSDRNVTGQLLFTIANLKFSDGGTYTAVEGPAGVNNEIVLSVYYGPQQCGTPLKSGRIINSGENLVVSTGNCGKPRPIVNCMFAGQTYEGVNVTEVNLFNYTYTFDIPTNLKACERERLICTANGHGKPVTEDVTIIGNFTEEKRISGGVCAGHIIGFEVGVILLCVFIYLYLVVWGATKEAGKLAGFIIAIVAGVGLIIGFAVAYDALRKTSKNDDCSMGSIALKKCDNAFIAMGVIDFIALLVVTLASVKLLKDFGSETSADQRRDSEKTPLKTESNKLSKGKYVETEDSV